MQMPEWTGPAIWSAIGGAVVITVVGFSAGWVVTTGSAQARVEESTTAATTRALTPYCVANFADLSQQQRTEHLAALEDESSYSQPDYVEEQGWATLLGDEEPNEAVAEACAPKILDRAEAESS